MLIVITFLACFYIGLIYGIYQDFKKAKEKREPQMQQAREQRELKKIQRQQKKTAKRLSTNQNNAPAPSNSENGDNSYKSIDDTRETTVENIIKDLDYYIMSLDGHQFEYFCAELLKGNGFTNVKVTQGSGDQGVDILAIKEGVRYAVQCKNYSSSLGNTPIQEVNAGKQLYNCHVGVVMTNSTFTQGAIKLAEATGTLLWDGRHVLRLAQNSPSSVAKFFEYLLK